MTPSPEQPEDTTKSQQAKQRPRAPARGTVSGGDGMSPTLAEAPSLGETLLPFLFAAMEACWIDAIFIGLASIDLFQSHDTLMPLWGPFVLIIGSQLILSLLESRASMASTADGAEENEAQTTMPGSSLFILFISVMTLCIIWVSIYAQTAAFYDPRWLFSLLNDVLLFNQSAYHLFSIVAISLYFCWRSVRLLHREYEPSQVFGRLRLGLGIIIVVILVRAGQTGAGVVLNDELMLLLLVPIFLFLSLSAHALARITFVRHTHRLGFEGDVSPQERSVLLIIGMLGGFLLLIAWLVDTLASPALLSNTQQLFALLGQIYGAFVQVLAIVAIFFATPIFWLITWIGSLLPSKAPKHATTPNGLIQKSRFVPPQGDSATVAAFVLVLKIVIPVLLFVLAILIIRWALRRRRHALVRSQKRAEELHESLWSWSLFWTQFRALLRALFGRFLPEKSTQEEEATTVEEMLGEPAARSIREIYRALLKRAAMRGYPRKRDETPYEFRLRLDEKIPLVEPQLSVVTTAYNATRYGGIVPADAEVAQIQQEWASLEQKWQ